jgi:hypothetical protein
VALALIVTYSDLIPGPTRDFFHALALKQMLLLAATVYGVWKELETVSSRRLPV